MKSVVSLHIGTSDDPRPVLDEAKNSLFITGNHPHWQRGANWDSNRCCAAAGKTLARVQVAQTETRSICINMWLCCIIMKRHEAGELTRYFLTALLPSAVSSGALSGWIRELPLL